MSKMSQKVEITEITRQGRVTSCINPVPAPVMMPKAIEKTTAKIDNTRLTMALRLVRQQHILALTLHPTHTHKITVNGLLIPRRYVVQVASPDTLSPDFKNPYLSVAWKWI